MALLLLGFTGKANAQGSVHGYVTDAGTGETLLLANVLVSGTLKGAATNNTGYYNLAGLDAGDHELIFSYIGYQPLRMPVTLAEGENLRLDVKLEAHNIVTEGVVVSAAREDEEERLQIGVGRMPVRMVTQLPALFEADLFRSLQMLPGIKASSDFSSGLIIRGGSPDQTLIMIDRTTVYNPSHFFGLFSTFNPDAIKDVQLYKGNYPSRFGGRLGSVVDVYNKDGNREHLQGKVSVGLLASRASIEGPLARGSWMIAARRSTLEPLLAAMRNSVSGLPDAFYFYDVNARINLDLGQKDRLTLGGYAGSDKLRVSPFEDLALNLPYGNQTGNLTWTHLFSHQFFGSFAFTGSHYFNLPVFSIGGSEFKRRNQAQEFTFKSDFEYAPGGRHTFEAGLWAGQQEFSLSDRGQGEGEFDLKTTSLHGSAYLQDSWALSPRWTFKGGARLQYFEASDHFAVEPRVSIEHQPLSNLRFQAAYGRYHQFLTLVTFGGIAGSDLWLASGEGVSPSNGDQFGVGMKYLPAEGLRFDVELYYRTMNDLFELDPNVVDPIGLEYADYFRFGEGYAYGAEVLLQKETGRLNGFIGYTFGRTERKFPGVNRDEYFPMRYDRTHDLSAVVNYDLSRTWRITAAFSYGSGQPYTRALGRTQFHDPFTSVPDDQVVVGRVNASRLPAYHRVDVGFTRKGRFFKLGESEFQIQAINAYNHRNVWFYEYDFEENPIALSTVEMLPLIPNISYSVEF